VQSLGHSMESFRPMKMGNLFQLFTPLPCLWEYDAR
jgi:hypothetical protein